MLTDTKIKLIYNTPDWDRAFKEAGKQVEKMQRCLDLIAYEKRDCDGAIDWQMKMNWSPDMVTHYKTVAARCLKNIARLENCFNNICSETQFSK